MIIANKNLIKNHLKQTILNVCNKVKQTTEFVFSSLGLLLIIKLFHLPQQYFNLSFLHQVIFFFLLLLTSKGMIFFLKQLTHYFSASNVTIIIANPKVKNSTSLCYCMCLFREIDIGIFQCQKFGYCSSCLLPPLSPLRYDKCFSYCLQRETIKF